MAERATDAGLGATIPAFPVRDVTDAVEFYRERFGFEPVHATDDFAVIVRDGARLHLWRSADETWRTRADFATEPIRSGAESFLAGTHSCRIETEDVDGLFTELAAAGVLHGVSQKGPTDTDFGTREFSTLDLEGNLLEFFRWREAP